MSVKPKIAIALICAAFLSSCETTANSDNNIDVNKLPEVQAHWKCLRSRALQHAKSSGSPLELGTIAAGTCSGTRLAMGDAITKVKGPYYARGYVGQAEAQDASFVGGLIIDLRS